MMPLGVIGVGEEVGVFVWQFLVNVTTSLVIIGIGGDKDPFAVCHCLLCHCDLRKEGLIVRCAIVIDIVRDVVVK